MYVHDILLEMGYSQNAVHISVYNVLFFVYVAYKNEFSSTMLLMDNASWLI